MNEKEQNQFITIAEQNGLSNQTSKQLVAIIEKLEGNEISSDQMQENLKKLIRHASVE